MNRNDHDELADRLLEFAVRVGKAVDALPDSRLGRHIAGQLVRSGTSPAPNYAEACGAESRKDFIHKLSICLKELCESRCWIQRMIKSELLSESQMASLQDACTQLCNIYRMRVKVAVSEKGSGTNCRNGPSGASHNWFLTPFPKPIECIRLANWPFGIRTAIRT